MKKSKILTVLLFLISVFAPMQASADSNAIQAAEWAVRQAIRGRLGPNSRVSFEPPTERLLSLTEEVISGVAHTFDADGWEFDRTLNYTIKVKYDGSSTRDLEITFNNGEKISDRSGWKDSKRNPQNASFSRPHWYEKLDSGRVTFEGEANSEVQITVYNRRNERVAETTLRPVNGRFRTTLNVPDGQLKAIVSPTRSSDYDEVRFSVSEDNHDWGHPAELLRVDQPTRDASVKGPRVTVSGRTSEREVRVRIWDNRNRNAADRRLQARGGFWDMQVSLEDGEYRLLVEGARSRETRNFSVWNSRPPFETSRPFVNFREPSDNSSFKNGRITISGNASTRSVRVQIMDSRNNRFLERDVPTQGNYWNTHVVLEDGQYRITVRNDEARFSETRTVTIRTAGKPSSGLMVSVRVDEPKREGIAKGPRVTFSGYCGDRFVKLQIWDSRNNRIENRSVPTRDAYWNSQVLLQPGRYRLRAEDSSGRDFEEFWFEVK